MLGEVTETIYTVEEDEDENEHIRVLTFYAVGDETNGNRR